MGAVWLVASREFRERIRRRGFLLAALGTPLLLIVLWVATALLAVDLPRSAATPPSPRLSESMGYVDQAGLVGRIPPPLVADRVRAYPDVAAGAGALRRREIDALYVIPADYVETGAVQRISRELPPVPPDDRAIHWLLAGNLFPEATPAELARLLAPLGDGGPEMVIRAADGGRGDEARQLGDLASDLRPFLAAVAVILPLLTGGGYLFQSFADEKEGRVLEILLLSASPVRLLAGKLLGIGALTLVQYLAWAIILGPVLLGIGAVAGTGGLAGGAGLVGPNAGWTVPFAAAGFLLYAVLAAGVGALAPSTESSRSWLFLISLPMMAPLYLWLVVVQRPDGPLAVAMSLFPFSAPAGMILRLAGGPVPGWQLGLSLALLVATAAALVAATARLFRVHLLLGGERLSLRRLWRTLLAG